MTSCRSGYVTNGPMMTTIWRHASSSRYVAIFVVVAGRCAWSAHAWNLGVTWRRWLDALRMLARQQDAVSWFTPHRFHSRLTTRRRRRSRRWTGRWPSPAVESDKRRPRTSANIVRGSAACHLSLRLQYCTVKLPNHNATVIASSVNLYKVFNNKLVGVG